MRRYIQTEIKFSDFVMFRPTLLNILYEILFTCIFPFFCFIVKSKHYRMHFLHNCHKFQIKTVFISIAHMILYVSSSPPPPFWHQFLHLMIQIDTSMFIDTDRKTVKHTNTEKSWRGMSKDKFYMFSVSNRCRMGFRQIPVNRNLIQIKLWY